MFIRELYFGGPWIPISISSVKLLIVLFNVSASKLHFQLEVFTNRLMLLLKASRKTAVECLAHFNVFSSPLGFLASQSGCMVILTSNISLPIPVRQLKIYSTYLTLDNHFLLFFRLSSPLLRFQQRYQEKNCTEFFGSPPWVYLPSGPGCLGCSLIP